MLLAKKKLVTIIAPEAVEDPLVEALAPVTRGLSVVPARGLGAHGARPNQWRSGNLQIETLVAAADVERLLDVLERFPTTDPPLIAWVADVEAWPAKKFV